MNSMNHPYFDKVIFSTILNEIHRIHYNAFNWEGELFKLNTIAQFYVIPIKITK